MKRNLFICALFAAAAVALTAQQMNQQGPYQGVSNPPSDDSITTMPDVAPAQKPAPGRLMSAQPATVAQPEVIAQPAPQPAAAVQPQPNQFAAMPGDGTDDGIVQIAPAAPEEPGLNRRASMGGPAYDPSKDLDGDIVHPDSQAAMSPAGGAEIRVRLLNDLSTSFSEDGERFRSRVASDVIQGGQVIIPTGAEIDGTVTAVSTGKMGGHGSMRLHPDTVILNDGSQYHLYAQLSGAPGSGTSVNGEGVVAPGSRFKKDGIEYGSAVGVGAVTGAILGGPAGALAGTLIGAGAITVHLLVSHPQARLDSGTVLLFTLNEPLNLVPSAPSGN